jgi:hypothetical protein
MLRETLPVLCSVAISICPYTHAGHGSSTKYVVATQGNPTHEVRRWSILSVPNSTSPIRD